MFTIVGSGFGLYGYLPALVETFGGKVLLPRAYENKFLTRPELRRYLDAIEWVADADSALRQATGVVVATPPGRQENLLSEIHKFSKLQTLVLEKPVATLPESASQILLDLKRAGRRYRIGYTLLHTSWISVLNFSSDEVSIQEISIEWKFMAHHFKHNLQNWKRNHDVGGGVLRFYGIHLLALLGKLGYERVDHSHLIGAEAQQPERWQASFSGRGLARCQINVDSRSGQSCFNITAKGKAAKAIVALPEPFQQEAASKAGAADLRVGVLVRLLKSFESPDDRYQTFAEAVNTLWMQTEAVSSFATQRQH